VRLTDVVEIGRAVLIEGRWEPTDPDGPSLTDPLYQVLTLRDGRIVEMQDCKSRDKALRYAKTRA
jgi:hypothetical protein